jgi:hypothetical protein
MPVDRRLNQISNRNVSTLGVGSGYYVELSDLMKHEWSNVDLGGDTLIQTVLLKLIYIGAMWNLEVTL